MKVLIFQTGEPLPIDGDSLRLMRAGFLRDFLVLKGETVRLISSRFFHQTKQHRHLSQDKLDAFNCVLIDSPGYKVNIGPRRFIDHAVLAWNLAKRLEMEATPDAVFIGYPPIEAAYVLAKWCQKRGVPYVIDVKDLWPQIFVDFFPSWLRGIARLLFLPWFFMAKSAIDGAFAVCSISEPFLNEVKRNVGLERQPKDFVAHLTRPKDESQKCSSHSVFVENDLVAGANNRGQDVPTKLVFAGSFTRVFDFLPLKYALTELELKGLSIRVELCGDGPNFNQVKEIFQGFTNVNLNGWVTEAELKQHYLEAFATFAPYKPSLDFDLSIPNKLIESFSMGLPVITSIGGYARHLILSNSQLGEVYEHLGDRSGANLAMAIESLINRDRIQVLRDIARFYGEHFDFDTNYSRIRSALSEAAH